MIKSERKKKQISQTDGSRDEAVSIIVILALHPDSYTPHVISVSISLDRLLYKNRFADARPDEVLLRSNLKRVLSTFIFMTLTD